MLVKLPCECSGEEVVRAFVAATTFQESPERRWEAREFVGDFQYELGPVKQTIQSKWVRACPSVLRNKGLFGQKVWKIDFTPTFTLTALGLANRYDSVEVAVYYVYGFYPGGGERVATDPHHPRFEDIRPQLEKILGNFYARLQSPA